MVCNIQEVPSCPLAHCTQFPALLSAPSFAWQGLTVWLLICLALDSTLILSWLSTCDHKGGMPDDAPYCCSSEQHTAHIVPHTIPSLPPSPTPLTSQHSTSNQCGLTLSNSGWTVHCKSVRSVVLYVGLSDCR